VDKEIRADIDRAKELGLEFDHQIASKVQVETDEETETQKQRAGQ
jgi:capsid protein